MGKFQVISHPLIQHKLSILRREDTSTKDFRELVNEIAMLMGYEVSRDLPLEEVEIQTPIIKTVQKQLSGKKLAIVPILRAGIGMVDGFLSLVPAAKVGHIGMYRDWNTQSHQTRTGMVGRPYSCHCSSPTRLLGWAEDSSNSPQAAKW